MINFIKVFDNKFIMVVDLWIDSSRMPEEVKKMVEEVNADYRFLEFEVDGIHLDGYHLIFDEPNSKKEELIAELEKKDGIRKVMPYEERSEFDFEFVGKKIHSQEA